MTTQVTEITAIAPAKVNLFLHVIGRRENGYHELQSVFRPLELADQLEIAVKPGSPDITVYAPESLGRPQDNLAWRAASAFLDATQCEWDIRIELDKRIPVGAGLGGGSSDAASVLLALNELSDGLVSAVDLRDMALGLGADVPFFLLGSDAWVEGVGEVVIPIEIPDRWFVLVNPCVHVSTAEIFQSKELTRSHEVRTISRFLEEVVREEQWVNDLEPVVCSRFAEVRALQRWFRGYGAARMSGSGSTFFLECRSEGEARSIAREVPPNWWHCVTKSLRKPSSR